MNQSIQSFRDLNVYQKAFELQQLIYEVSKTFPKDELYSLADQIRRSSRSIGSNIAEAWQKRRYEAHFFSKLTDADSEQAETQHWLDTAHSCSYLNNDQYKKLLDRCQHIGSMLGKMMAQSKKFCIKPK